MIDYEHFQRAMKAISERCARPPGPDQLAMYYRFLSPRLTTEEFHEAAMSVWSSAEFFPPPVKFLEARCGREYDRVMRLLDEFTPPHVPEGWAESWKALSEETKKAVARLGGPLSFKDRLYNRDPAKAFQLFTQGYVVALRDEAAAQMVEAEEQRPRLSSGKPRLAGDLAQDVLPDPPIERHSDPDEVRAG